MTRRAHSVSEMRQYLERRADRKDFIAETIARLRAEKYLDDSRYAAEFARRHMQSRRQGRFRIVQELRARGVADEIIHAAVEAAFAEVDEAELVRARLGRLLPRAPRPRDQRKLASAYRSLLRAGFSPDVIRAELSAWNLDSAGLPGENDLTRE